MRYQHIDLPELGDDLLRLVRLEIPLGQRRKVRLDLQLEIARQFFSDHGPEFLPLDMAHDGSLFAAVAPSHALTAFAVVVATAVAVLGQLYRIEGRIPLCEPDSLLVLLIVVGALLLVYRLS